MNNFTIFPKNIEQILLDKATDVLEIRSDSKASYYPQYTINLSSPTTNQNIIPIGGNSHLVPSFSASSKKFKDKKLPPIENETNKNNLNQSLDSSLASTSSDLKSSLSPIVNSNLNQFKLADYSNCVKLISTQIGDLDKREAKLEFGKSRPPTAILSSDNLGILPATENKKRAPNNLDTIDPLIKNKVHNNRLDLNTPVIIDILSESGRYSKQSLDPLTFRESSAKYSSRPSSLKESIFRKSSGKLKRLNSTPNADLDKTNASVPKMNKTKKLSTNSKSYSIKSINDDQEMQSDEDDHSKMYNIDFYSSGGECNDSNETNTKTSEIKPNINANEQQPVAVESSENENAKLETIKESINELIHVNIRKLELNDKNKTNDAQPKPAAAQNGSSSNNTNKNEASPAKPNGILKNKPTARDTARCSNSAKPPISNTANKNTSPKKETTPVKKQNDFAKGLKTMNQLNTAFSNINKNSNGINKSITNVNLAQKNQQPATTSFKNSRSNSVEKTQSNKPSLNLDLYTPTSNKQCNEPAPAQKPSANKQPCSTSSKPPLKPSFTLETIPSTSNLSYETGPTVLETSRIVEKNKKSLSKQSSKQSLTKELKSFSREQSCDILSESLQTTSTNLTNNSMIEPNDVTARSNSKKSLDPTGSLTNLSNPKITKDSLRLEITSSRINLAEKPSSAKSIASIHLTPHHNANLNENLSRLLSAANKLNQMPDPSVFYDKNFFHGTTKHPSSAKSNIGQPTQPIIYDMFENFPQPFASKAISEANLLDKMASKKKKAKANYKVRSMSSSKNNTKPAKKKNSASKTRPKATNGALKKSKSTDKSKIEISGLGLSNTELDKENLIDSQVEEKEPDPVKSVEAEYDESFEHEDFETEHSSSDEETTEIEDKKVGYESDNSVNDLTKLNKSEADLSSRELTNRLNKDFVKSFEDRVFAIYSKYDNLIDQQVTKIDRQQSESASQQNNQNVAELNMQKAEFSNEIARELRENVNFEEISSNPELVKRLKELYSLVEKNGANIDNKTENSSSKPPLVNVRNADGVNSLAPVPQPRKNSQSIGSLRSAADIREVYSIVNSFNVNQKNNSMHSTGNNLAELTIPAGEGDLVLKGYDGFNGIVKAHNNQNSKATYKLPTTLSDKINTLMAFAQLPDEKEDSDENSEQNNSSGDQSNENNHNNKYETLQNFKSHSSNQGQPFNENSKLKFNYINSLNNVGEETNNSASFDPNSISYHYDVKYKSGRSKSPISLRIENENEVQFRWKRGNLIGKGAFGSVYQAMLNTGVIIAVKQIEMEESDPSKARQEYDNVREEVKILRELDHINIVQFMGTMLDGNVVNIFMELIPGGTIETLLKIYGAFEESLFKNFTNQILEGVNYIHSRNVVHRDIKGKNIMLMGNGVIKLIDFGCAKRLKKNQSSNSIKQLLKSLKGTPYWMSPEVIRETGHGSKADIWSTGATIFEMATGSPPFANLAPISAIYAIGSGESPPPELPSRFSSEARDFVSKCLTRDPDQRPSAAELLQHEFLKQNQ